MMKYISFIIAVSLLFISTTYFVSAEKIRAAAYLSPVDKAGGKAKYGRVIFEQDTMTNPEDKNINPVKVDVSELKGFPEGLYGFHIHQFGDLIQPGTHFIPICTGPDPTEPTTTTAAPSSCQDDATHGFPLGTNNKYQAGDLGNIKCKADGTCQICVCTTNEATETGLEGITKIKYNDPTCNNCQDSQNFKGEKFTLRPPPVSVTNDIDRSVVARALVVHSQVDHGGPPFGNVCIPLSLSLSSFFLFCTQYIYIYITNIYDDTYLHE